MTAIAIIAYTVVAATAFGWIGFLWWNAPEGSETSSGLVVGPTRIQAWRERRRNRG